MVWAPEAAEAPASVCSWRKLKICLMFQNYYHRVSRALALSVCLASALVCLLFFCFCFFFVGGGGVVVLRRPNRLSAPTIALTTRPEGIERTEQTGAG